ncbi:sugar phosphate isomerase/epimerase family protein [Tunturiibacter empetritectus]|uniref:sugar phosphate isomerase/epimerase family protein n=1 Tax=Tunturiibacter empetritectus TaxID=3069691 RepID=UPI003D9BC714
MMQPGISTHVFLPQRLHPGLLDSLHKAGAQVIELFAARHHFDYTDRAAVRDIATWFRNTGVGATLHQPLYISDRADAQWSRHVAPNLNLIDPEKSRRISAMDEVKRALESAEQIPISACTLHLGYKDDAWNLRALENSLTAIEHLKAFAHPLGVRILLENLQNEITTPEHLLEILKVGHFDRVGVTLDIGHAHLAAPPIAASAASPTRASTKPSSSSSPASPSFTSTTTSAKKTTTSGPAPPESTGRMSRNTSPPSRPTPPASSRSPTNSKRPPNLPPPKPPRPSTSSNEPPKLPPRA